jgi:DNA invertase Pin-like site-specific DNA recombinase
MSRRRPYKPPAPASTRQQVRCAIYTRKSSDEGLDQEFNSLDAQRDSAEAYIASQKAEGWQCLPERYDDGGFSGGSMERPALDRLLRDVKEGKIDCVVVYKVDRLSRSLLDFSRIMETFERFGVSFVSVTQHFNTTTSMGRLTLNILLSFAQFEREIIGERIRDKLAAQKVAYKGEVYEGEHEAIIDIDIFNRVQARLRTNGRAGSAEARTNYAGLLRGILRCKGCNSGMTHTFTGAKKGRAYRYYRCIRAIKRGAEQCKTGTLPAPEMERIVIDEIRALPNDGQLLKQVCSSVGAAIKEELCAVTVERDILRTEAQRNAKELRRLSTQGMDNPAYTARIAELNERLAVAEKRLPEIEARIAELERESITNAEAEAAFRDFDVLWDNLTPKEQCRLVRLLVSRVEYDAENASVAVTFHPSNMKCLAHRTEEALA